MSMTRAKNAAKAALVAAALGTTFVSVQAQGAPYVFTAIDTGRHGVDVVDGRYDKAIARIRQKSGTDTDFSESTSLCIAYTKSGDSVQAMKNCDRAVDIARNGNGMPRSLETYATYLKRSKDLDLVIALSNRGVARATSGDYATALEDLQEADELRPSLRAVSRNLEVLAEAINAPK